MNIEEWMQTLTFEKFNELPYNNYFVLESLRINTPFEMGIPWYFMKPITIGKYKMLPDHPCQTGIYHLARNPK